MDPAVLQFVSVVALILLTILSCTGFALAWSHSRVVTDLQDELRHGRDLYTTMVGERDEARSYAMSLQRQLDAQLADTTVVVPRTGPTSLPTLMAPAADDEASIGTGPVEVVYEHRRPTTGPFRVQQAQVVEPAPAAEETASRPVAVRFDPKPLTLVQLRRAVRRHDHGEAWATVAADLGVAASTLQRQVAKAGDAL